MEDVSLKGQTLVPQSPLILRCFRLMEAFAKSDDERDFFLDRVEGAIFYVDLERSQEDLDGLYAAINGDPERYCLLPKFTFYETKKIMEGFVNEKIYDIDTKEKLIDIISVKGAREHFIEFLHDHLSEQEKWIQYYQERSRIRIIEWLRKQHFQFVFEEDVELDRLLLEKVKTTFFHKKIAKEIETARKILMTKAKTYYSNEALNPRPKRGRPPKQVAKQEAEPQVSADIYTTVPKTMSPFLFTPSVGQSWAATFSSKFDEESSWSLTKLPNLAASESDDLSQKLAALRQLARNSGVVVEEEETIITDENWENDEEDDDEEDDLDFVKDSSRTSASRAKPAKKVTTAGKPAKIKSKESKEKTAKTVTSPTPKAASTKASPAKAAPAKAASAKGSPTKTASAKTPSTKASPVRATPAKTAAKAPVASKAPSKPASASPEPKKTAPPTKKPSAGKPAAVKKGIS